MKRITFLSTLFLAAYVAKFKRIVTLAFFCLAAVMIFAADPERRTIEADGFTREYLLYTPQNDNPPEGILLCLHAFNGYMQDFFDLYNFSEIADAQNCIILAPQALPQQDQASLNPLVGVFLSLYGITLNSPVWGCGLQVKANSPTGGITVDEELNKNVNDADFIATIIDNTINEFGLDGRNVFALGISIGGYMAYQFALKHGDKLSGLISISGSMGLNIKAADSPVKVPVCDFHSLTDNIVPYQGSFLPPPNIPDLVITLGKDKAEVIDYWVNNNMAGSTPVVEDVNYYPSSNGITVEKFTYPDPDYEVIHYKMNGSLHYHFFTKGVDCMDYKEEILKFIQSHVTVPDAGDSILYVKKNNIRLRSVSEGSSWENAYPELADALRVAKTNKNIKEIWVAAGTYKPLYAADGASTYSHDNAFVLVEGVKIYGGFPADANDTDHTSVETGRAPSLHATILDGDNACHVVIGANIAADSETILDGFTITGGYAIGGESITVNEKTVFPYYGGGIFNTYSSPTLTNLIISGNAAGTGGGIFNDYSSPTLTNLTVSENSAINGGGGIANYEYSSPALTNVTISGNTASDEGGGIYNYDRSSPTLTNVTISGNTAGSVGGGIYNYASASPKLYNSIVWGNTASGRDNNVSNTDYSYPTYSYSLVQGEILTGIGNLDGNLDPQFVSPAAASSAPTTTGNYRLKAASPLIDKGDNELYGPTLLSDVDLDGNPRLLGASIDLGAYEFSELVWTGLAGNSWTEPANWKFGKVPDEASSVSIPGGLGTYPVLTEADFAAVKDIRFEPGAEIGRQDLLSYEKAYVQLNFSATASRNRWYMLSNPLQELYAGDFSFGGYPGIDMKLFETDPNQGNKAVWKQITGYDKSFSAGDGFIVWLAPDPTGKGTKGLISSNGILELPYFDNANVPADVHWTHHYIEPNSTFGRWEEKDGLIVATGTPTITTRDPDKAYLLAGQTVNKTLNFGEDQFAIAGNPYMSSIDFRKLQEANPSVITGTYYIWIGPGGSNSINPGSYAIYNALTRTTTGRTGVELNDSIVPMQAFIVDKSAAARATATLAFDLATIGTTDGSARLRSAAPQGDKLAIVASTAQAGIRTLIASRQEGGDSFGSSDSRKLFDEINSNPEVYTLKPKANNEQVATAVNVLGEITGETLIPLAISTTYSGELSFTFSGMDTYNARISLLDTETNTETELTDKAQYEYKFDYVPEQSGEKIVANESRFFIRLNKVITGIEEIASEAIRIYAPYPGTLQVVSTHPLRQVTVYNLQGSVVYNTSAIQANTQKVEGLAGGVYIVKAVSGNTVTTEKVVVR